MQFDLLRRIKTSSSCAVLYCLFSSGAVVAAEWSIEPSISLREEYNDNIRFTPSLHPGVWQSRLSPSLRLSSKTEVSEVSGSVQLGVNQYVGDPAVEDHNDKQFSLFSRLQSERNTWSMNASYKQDSTAESERASTGVVHQTRTQRSLFSLSPSWIRMLTERASLKLDYNYQEVKYGVQTNTLTDYTYQHVGGMLNYQWSERDLVSLSATYSKTDSAPTTAGPILIGSLSGFPVGLSTTTDNKSDMLNVQLGIDHEFSETLRGSVALGKRNTLLINEQSQAYCWTLACLPLGAPVSTKNEIYGNGYSYSASLEKTFDTAKVSGSLSREVKPSGSGLVETDVFSMSLNKSLTETMTGTVDAIAYRTKYISLTNPGSRYYTLEPKLNWRFTEWWTLNGGYRYARYEPESTATAITSNAVYLNLTYNWPKMAVSR